MVRFASLCASFVAAIFFSAAYGKLSNTSQTVETFKGWGVPASTTTVQLLIIEELAVGAIVVFWPDLGAYLALASMAIFTVFVLRALSRGVKTKCPCFGSVSSTTSNKTVIQNAVVMAACVIAPAASHSPSAALIRTISAVLGAAAYVVFLNSREVDA